MTDVDPGLLESAYRAAIYEVSIAGRRVALRIGETPVREGEIRLDPPLAIITAYNPGSIRATDDANEAAQRQLRDQVMFTGWEWYPAKNSAPGGTYAEDSLAIFGISRNDALKLARKFAQAAFVYWVGEEVELVWPRDTPDAEG